MQENFNELDVMMGFNPSDLSVFNEVKNVNSNPNIYRTSPKNSQAEDGHYHSRVRLLYNPFNIKRTIVHSATYYLRDSNGGFVVNSLLGENDPNSPYFQDFKNCPIFKAWKKLHYSEDPAMNDAAKNFFEKNEADYILCQVVEDKNQPDMVGKIVAWKLPKGVSQKLQAKLQPSKDSGKIPINVLDYLSGRILEIDVTPGPDDKKDPSRYYRETNYDLCEFDSEISPLMKIDGTPLFTDEEIETIERYDKKLIAISKMSSPEKQAESYQMLRDNELYAKIKGYMKRAVDYAKENAVNLIDEVGYKPWAPDVAARVDAWIKVALTGKNPAGEEGGNGSFTEIFGSTPATPSNKVEATQVEIPNSMEEDGDDLPF